MYKLGILIPTVDSRAYQLAELINEINLQIDSLNAFESVCIYFLNNNKKTGDKRNELIDTANCEYVWFVDDDDMIMPNAIKNILQALESNPDALAINGIMTTDNKDERQWFIAKDNPYIADYSTGKEVYLRYTNHITPIKKEIAKLIGFPSVSNFEDKDYADRLKESGLIKTEVLVQEPVYHYKYSTQNKLY